MTYFFQNLFGDKIAAKPEIRVIPGEWSEGMDENMLTANGFYFDIRLCELYLRKSAEAGRSFVPRALAITECLYAQGQELTLPVAVGDHILAQIDAETDAGGKHKAVSFSNCLLAGPMPYRGGDIGFFNGLYRVERGNVADSVFNLVADVTGSFGLNLTNYLNVGRQLANRLPSLLGLDSGDWRIGHYAPIYKPGDRFFNRYLVLVGQDGDPFDIDALEIQQQNSLETLCVRNANGSKPFDARDYMLIKLNSDLERNDYERFDFHNRYLTVKNYLIGRQLEQAEWASIELNQEISACPDLTEDHQFGLVTYYEGRINKWKEKLGLIKKYQKSDHKGAADKDSNGFQTGAIASTAYKAKLPTATIDGLQTIKKEWENLEQLLPDADDDELSSESISGFLRVMSQKEIARGSAVDLVDAIKIHSLSQR
jgi:hypothetical protein